MIRDRFTRPDYESRRYCSLGSAILDAVGAVGDFAGSAVGAVGDAAGSVGSAIGDTASSAWNGASGALNSALGSTPAADEIGSEAWTAALADAPPGIQDIINATPDNFPTAQSIADAANTSSASLALDQTAAATRGLGAASDATKGGALSGLLGGTGISKTALALGALSALGSALSKPKIGTWQTPGPSSTAATQGPLWNMNLPSAASYGPPRTVSTPSDYNVYTAGFKPGTNYFANNHLTFPTPGAAHGGAIPGALTMAMGGSDEVSTARGDHYVEGPGTGTSDSIPAKLSDGEYILTANDVAVIGGGSNRAGARKIDKWREDLHRDVGGKKFIPKKAEGALARLSGGAR